MTLSITTATVPFMVVTRIAFGRTLLFAVDSSRTRLTVCQQQTSLGGLLLRCPPRGRRTRGSILTFPLLYYMWLRHWYFRGYSARHSTLKYFDWLVRCLPTVTGWGEEFRGRQLKDENVFLLMMARVEQYWQKAVGKDWQDEILSVAGVPWNFLT